MHAVEYIEKHCRFKRTISCTDLRKNLGREKGHCTWCNGELKNGLRSWCSDACRTEGYIRAGVYHGAVSDRDKGVCVLCGKKCSEIQDRLRRMLARANGHDKEGHWVPEKRKLVDSYMRVQRLMRAHRMSQHHRHSPFEIDHIVPVIEGGGCCGIDNLRTVCFGCHKQVTADLAARRAARRQDAKRPMFTDN